MADPLELRGELESALALASREAAEYVEGLAGELVLDPASERLLEGFDAPLPEQGSGALEALGELAERGRATATRSSGPRFFHFVIGGTTPAALGADWLTSAFDQVAFGWASSPLGAKLEGIAVQWLRQLFELPSEFAGVLVSGATMANFTGLIAARNWWADELGFDADEAGLAGSPRPRILSSGYIHPSAVQAIGMLGLGKGTVERLTCDAAGRLDLEALAASLENGDGPAIVVANAGEVNAGDFDPIAAIAELTSRHGAWLHVDGAFGLFARLAPESRALTEGVELADSVTVDAHKWLNVPYDCGVSFVREPARLARALNVGAPYLPSPDDPRPNPGFLTPENSRRARALAVWATLRAYGRDGYRAMVERHLRLARHLAERVDEASELERLAEVQLNIVCFRARPPDVGEDELDQLNRRLGEALLADGRVFAGTTVYEGRVAFRPAIVNWQTTEADVEMLIDVLLELIEEER
ncbi:MAG TPA: aminotransferase class V-fold PLP-dependent enzyme [Solirubrobacterales bacterium]|jgi:glutamate/tyrosine decarboxylase-like PLP-dependent enzyme